jgi:hypothetical protein
MDRWMAATLAVVLAGAWSATGTAAARGEPTPDTSAPAMGSPRSESSSGGGEDSRMRRDPHSGTMVPESNAAPEGQRERDARESGASRQRMRDMAQVPAGIGERGTGQTQSTLERSGEPAEGRR